MEKIIVLGTSAATAIEGFNTCFVLEDSNKGDFLVDTGGGIGILRQLKHANVEINSIHNIFISHRHADHSLGILWLFRAVNMAMAKGSYEGDLNIYCHDEVARIVRMLVTNILVPSQQTFLDKRIFIKEVKDNDIIKVEDYDVNIYDINARGDKQYGFMIKLNNGKTLAFNGDEPLQESLYEKIRGVDYLLHEAHCLESEIEKFEPYKKNHDTVASASRKAEQLEVKNLVLWHSQENLGNRKKDLYTEEAKAYFSGNVYVPDCLEIIELD